MRVLHLIPGLDPTVGGPTAFLTGLAAAQQRAGMAVRVISSWKGQAPSVDELRAEGVQVMLLGPALGPLWRHRDLHGRIEQELRDGCDVVHLHGVWEDIQRWGALLADKFRVPYVVTPHGTLTEWSLSQRAFRKRLYIWWRLKRILRGAAAIHFTTQQERRQTQPFKERCHIAARDLVEPVGLDLREFGEPERRRGLNSGWMNGRYIFFLGRIVPGKGLEYLVPAMASVQPADTKLIAAGWAPDEGYARRWESEAKASQRTVALVGGLKRQEVIAALENAAVFCLPSDHENFGIVVAEAMAAGCPVVISDQVGIADDVAESGAGSIAPREPVQLGLELTRWLTNPELRAAAAEKGKSFARERYDWLKIAGRWRDHYDELAAGRGQPSLRPAP